DMGKEKVETKMCEMPIEPVEIAFPHEESTQILKALYELVQQHPGRKPLVLRITAKLQDIVMETDFKVADTFMEAYANSFRLKLSD
ncbi:MAG: hypothetical protein GX780_00990, partial [Campylobacteraceae bacterium]|nr:hypothetical protein [Campylobacteraceae bacterium]